MSDVSFDSVRDTFSVEGAIASPEEVRLAVLKTVVFPRLRGILGSLGGRLRR